MAERQLPKLNVAGSIPVSRSNIFNDLDPSSLCFLPVCSISAPFAFTIAAMSLKMNRLRSQRGVSTATPEIIRKSDKLKRDGMEV